ncbi:CPBP family intramembrane metalloprotease [Akkermansiaceae bacterium]|nr:CPBP family intramembrane metalloprotease [Akkermansiaceae bacterium]
MENITFLSVNVAYGAALALLVLAALFRQRLAAGRPAGEPPAHPAGKVAVWPYRGLDLLGFLMVIGVFYMMAALNAVAGDSDAAPKINAVAVAFSIGFQFFMAGIVIIVVIGRVNPVAWLGLAWKKWPMAFLIAPMAVVSMWVLFAGLQVAGYMDLLDKLGVEKVQDTVTMFQTEKDIVVLVLLAVAAALVAPICEEIVFRGYLYPVAKKYAGPWVAALATALIFSAAHGSFSALLPLFAFGLALVAIYEFTGSIWAPMAVHFLFNSATVAAQFYIRFADIDVKALQ